MQDRIRTAGRTVISTPAVPMVLSAVQTDMFAMQIRTAGRNRIRKQYQWSHLQCRQICARLQMFSEAALAEMEGGADKVDAKARAGRLPPECWHATVGRGGQPKRTKFFFGARYLWTREQLASVAASRARGVRADVPGPPSWIQVILTELWEISTPPPPPHQGKTAATLC